MEEELAELLAENLLSNDIPNEDRCLCCCCDLPDFFVSSYPYLSKSFGAMEDDSLLLSPTKLLLWNENRLGFRPDAKEDSSSFKDSIQSSWTNSPTEAVVAPFLFFSFFFSFFAFFIFLSFFF